MLQLIAQYEVLSNLKIDHIAFRGWFDRLLEPEKVIINQYQDIRNMQQDQLFKLSHQEFMEYCENVSGIPGFFGIEEN